MSKRKNSGLFGLFSDFIRETVDYLFRRRVSVVIPAFNEAETIAKVIREAKCIFEVSEVIVVDDGSEDETAFAAKKAGVFALT